MDKYLVWALLIGGVSAASLPLGSVVGLAFRPKRAITGVAAAFGAGALIAALAVELVAPTAELIHSPGGKVHFAGLVFGAIVGGLLFVALDKIINSQGGFLRKTATTIAYFRKLNRQRWRQLLSDLGKIDLLRNIPPAEIRPLADLVRPRTFDAGAVLVEEGSPGDRMFFLREGEVELQQKGEAFKTIAAGDVLGEISLLTGASRTATAVAKTELQVLVLLKEDFDRFRRDCPDLDHIMRELASQRLGELSNRTITDVSDAEEWTEQAIAVLDSDIDMPTPSDVQDAKAEHAGAPLAIWLGILLDGIPESLVIGAGFLELLVHKTAAHGSVSFGDVMPYTLIAGLFLSNFPEAMSSSVGMQSQGWKNGRIVVMWTSLMVMTGVGAGIGYMLGGGLSETIVVSIEGMAAGAMLTMIASTMVPEAVHLVAPPVVGLSTLAGFLSAVAFKIFE